MREVGTPWTDEAPAAYARIYFAVFRHHLLHLWSFRQSFLRDEQTSRKSAAFTRDMIALSLDSISILPLQGDLPFFPLLPLLRHDLGYLTESRWLVIGAYRVLQDNRMG